MYGLTRIPRRPPNCAAVTPRTQADNPVGEWNHFHVTVAGNTVTVLLNEKIVIAGATIPDLPARGPLRCSTTAESGEASGIAHPASCSSRTSTSSRWLTSPADGPRTIPVWHGLERDGVANGTGQPPFQAVRRCELARPYAAGPARLSRLAAVVARFQSTPVSASNRATRVDSRAIARAKWGPIGGGFSSSSSSRANSASSATAYEFGADCGGMGTAPPPARLPASRAWPP